MQGSLEPLILVILVIYGMALLFIFFYSLSQLHLWVWYRKHFKGNNNNEVKPANEFSEWPKITVQLPIFNEYYVIERLMDAVASFDYPKDKLEIQVLDDSNDETVDLVAKKTQSLQEKGINCKHLRRNSREGFKAGALQYGLGKAEGEFIAIFDADFIPSRDFLKKTVPCFQDSNVGLVQTRWKHINKDYSFFTRAQALALDNHFVVEQSGRNKGGYFINFNGTAGIWRKATIEDAGGWHYDTLTEDLDLSYRAQLRNWQFRYMGDLGSPAELPAELNSIKSQQFRWTKGGAETARKMFPAVIKSKMPFVEKLHAFFHLFNSAIFVCVLTCALLSIPALVIKNAGYFPFLFKLASAFLLSLIIIAVIYFESFQQEYSSRREALKDYIWLFPLFLCITMGLSLHNGWAVIKGWFNIKSEFIRTPKFNLRSNKDNWDGKKYLKGKVKAGTLLEGILALYFAAGMFLAFKFEDFGLLPFHTMLFVGFGSVALFSFYHAWQVKRN